MNKIVTSLFVLCLLVFGFSEDRRREEFKEQQALNKLILQRNDLQRELDELRINRWQDKRNAIVKKQTFKEAWDKAQFEMDKLDRQMSQKNETVLSLKNQHKEAFSQLDLVKSRTREFGIQISELLENWKAEREYGFPEARNKIIANLSEIQKNLESSDFTANMADVHKLFAARNEDLKMSQSSEIKRTQFTFLNAGRDSSTVAGINVPKIEAGYEIRLGNIYKAFVSTESGHSAILGKSGNIGENSWVWLENLNQDVKDRFVQLKQDISGFQSGESPVNTIYFVPIDVQLKNSIGEGYVANERLGFLKELKEELIGVGFVLWILIPIIIIGLFSVTRKLVVFISKGLYSSERLGDRVINLCLEGKYFAAKNLCKNKNSSLARVLKAIIVKRDLGRGKVEDVTYEIMLHESATIEKNIGTINIMAAAAPLIGLLGTVSGMVNLFSAITLHGTSDPKVMASGISEALLSTKWGLLAAIPLLLLYNWVSNNSQKMISDMEKYSTRLINVLYTYAGADRENEMKELHADELNNQVEVAEKVDA